MRNVKMRQLHEALLRLGFSEPEQRGVHVVYRHDESATLVVLPRLGPSESVGRARLGAVRLSVIGREVATPEAFDDALEAVHAA